MKATIDATDARAKLLQLMERGWSARLIADEIQSCPTRIRHVAAGRVRTVSRDLYGRILSIEPLDLTAGCQRCEDIEVALLSSTDLEFVAHRLASSPAGLKRHLQRCGRADLLARFVSFDARWRCSA